MMRLSHGRKRPRNGIQGCILLSYILALRFGRRVKEHGKVVAQGSKEIPSFARHFTAGNTTRKYYLGV